MPKQKSCNSSIAFFACSFLQGVPAIGNTKTFELKYFSNLELKPYSAFISRLKYKWRMLSRTFL